VKLTEDEKAYMDYLDEVYDVPGGYGLLLYKADQIAFQLGLDEWLASNQDTNED